MYIHMYKENTLDLEYKLFHYFLYMGTLGEKAIQTVSII